MIELYVTFNRIPYCMHVIYDIAYYMIYAIHDSMYNTCIRRMYVCTYVCMYACIHVCVYMSYLCI